MYSVLTSLKIRRLRGIAECTIEGLADVNVFVGKNGSGKSTVLEAIYLTSAWVKPKDPIHGVSKPHYLIFRRLGRGTWRELRHTLWYKQKTDQPIEVEAKIEGKHLRFKVFYPIDDPKLAVWLEGNWYIQDVSDPLTYYNYANNIYLTNKMKQVNGRRREPIPDSLKKFLSGIRLIDSRFYRKYNLLETKIWPRLLKNRLDKEVVKILKEYEPDAEDLTLVPVDTTYYLMVKLPDSIIRIDDLGDGARSALFLTSILIGVENTAVLIEEPENHQHPGGVYTVLDFALNISKRKRIQLFITTHSIETIVITKQLAKQNNLSFKLFFLERNAQGEVDIRALDGVGLDLVRKLGLDPRFLYAF